MKSESALLNSRLFVEEGQEIPDAITVRVVGFLEEFTKAVWESLGEGEEKHGNKWLRSSVDYPREAIGAKIDQFFLDGKPINWASIAGYAMLAWIHDNHPELWDLE